MEVPSGKSTQFTNSAKLDFSAKCPGHPYLALVRDINEAIGDDFSIIDVNLLCKNTSSREYKSITDKGSFNHACMKADQLRIMGRDTMQIARRMYDRDMRLERQSQLSRYTKDLSHEEGPRIAFYNGESVINFRYQDRGEELRDLCTTRHYFESAGLLTAAAVYLYTPSIFLNAFGVGLGYLSIRKGIPAVKQTLFNKGSINISIESYVTEDMDFDVSDMARTRDRLAEIGGKCLKRNETIAKTIFESLSWQKNSNK